MRDLLRNPMAVRILRTISAHQRQPVKIEEFSKIAGCSPRCFAGYLRELQDNGLVDVYRDTRPHEYEVTVEGMQELALSEVKAMPVTSDFERCKRCEYRRLHTAESPRHFVRNHQRDMYTRYAIHARQEREKHEASKEYEASLSVPVKVEDRPGVIFYVGARTLD